MHIYIYTCIHVYICSYIYICIIYCGCGAAIYNAHIYIYICVHVYMIYEYIYMCICIYVYMCICVHVYIYTYICVHVYIYTHLQKCKYIIYSDSGATQRHLCLTSSWKNARGAAGKVDFFPQFFFLCSMYLVKLLLQGIYF